MADAPKKKKQWIKTAINPAHKGALREELHVPAGKPIPAAKLDKAAHSDNPTLAKRAVLAKTLKGFHHATAHAASRAEKLYRTKKVARG